MYGHWPYLQVNTDSPPELTDIKNDALAVLHKVEEDKQVRDDYKQFLMLALLYIEGKPDITGIL